LAKHECYIVLTDSMVEVGGRVYVKASAKIIKGAECIQVDGFAREAEQKKGMDTSQITGSTSSYARKYALNGLFAIDDNKEADTNQYRDQSQNTPAPPTYTAPQPDPKPEPAKTVETLTADLKACKTLTDLKTVWTEIGRNNMQTDQSLTAIKDELKGRLK